MVRSTSLVPSDRRTSGRERGNWLRRGGGRQAGRERSVARRVRSRGASNAAGAFQVEGTNRGGCSWGSHHNQEVCHGGEETGNQQSAQQETVSQERGAPGEQDEGRHGRIQLPNGETSQRPAREVK